TGLTRQRYYSRPVDAFTIGQYLRRHPETRSSAARDATWDASAGTPDEVARSRGLNDLRSVPVAQYAQAVAEHREMPGFLLPHHLIDTYLAMAEEARDLAKRAA